jgi:hypothetical protein
VKNANREMRLGHVVAAASGNKYPNIDNSNARNWPKMDAFSGKLAALVRVDRKPGNNLESAIEEKSLE